MDTNYCVFLETVNERNEVLQNGVQHSNDGEHNEEEATAEQGGDSMFH
jgi:hypothetical protein